MPDLVAMLGAVAGAAVEDADPYFNQTVLLLHGDGTNGAQNNTFLDSSTNNFTITRNPANGPNAPTQGTFSPFSAEPGKWGNYFDGTGDYLSVADNAAFSFGTGAFTIEAWVYGTGPGAVRRIYHHQTTDTNQISILQLDTNKLNFFVRTSSTTICNITSTNDLVANVWNHVVCVRDGSNFAAFINGQREGTASSATTAPDPSGSVLIGTVDGSTQMWLGYISNLRVVKGTAVYDPTLTTLTPSVPTTPLTNITNTSLLTCQSNRFVDNGTANSGTGFTITPNDNVRVTPFSPFAPSAAYSPSVNGGSGYFDGSGDYLSIADNAAFEFGSGDFCVELFGYSTAFGTSGTSFLGQWATSQRGWIFGYINSGTVFTFDYSTTGSNSTAVSASTTVPLNQWNHYVACRSSNTLSIYLNGSRIATASVTGVTIFAPNQALEIGRNAEGTALWNMNGNIANLRIVKGSSPYDATQTTLTIPTSPLTAIANTSVLLNFTNAGIFDQTGKNVLETVGDAQIDTTTKKYGTGSMEFDGTGDYLLLPHNPDQQLGTGNFTIEFWVYLASGDTGSARGLVAKGGASTGWLVSLDSSQKVVFTYTTSTITSSGAITTNAWNYIAVVREGTGSNQTKIYIGGVNDGTGTVSTDFNQTESMYIGANRTGGDAMKGFIDDLRITKGIARTITVPTSPFPDL